MSTNYTEHYQLSQWVPEDKVLREEFNENHRKIDKAIQEVKTGAAAATEAARSEAAKGLAALTADTVKKLGAGGKTCRIATGEYVGKGTRGKDNPNSITVDFKPQFVALGDGAGSQYHFLMRPRTGSLDAAVSSVDVIWGENTVSWYCGTNDSRNISWQCNVDGVTYYWVAFGEALS